MAVRKSKKRRAGAWQFRLYISGRSPRSDLALANLERTCRNHLQRGFRVRIVDIRKEPQIAARDNILAIPTLKRIAPLPERTVIGSLSDPRLLLKWLGLEISTPNHRAEPHADVLNIQEIGRA